MVVDLAIVSIGVLLPIIAMLRGIRFASIIFLALIPLYMYHKSMFALVVVDGQDLQWPTLAKDLVGVTLTILVGASWALRPQHWRNLSPELRRALAVFIAFGLYVIGISIARGSGIATALVGTRPYIFYQVLGILLGSLLFRTNTAWRFIADVLILGCLVIAALALVQKYVDPHFLILDSFRQIFNGKLVIWNVNTPRLRGYFTSANALAYLMSLGIICSIWRFRAKPRGYFIPFLPFCIATMAWALLLTLSRSAILGLALALAAMTLCHRGLKLRKLFSVPIVVVAASVLIVATPFSQRLQGLGNNPRLEIWTSYAKTSLSSGTRFVTGFGMGSLGRFGAEVAEGTVEVNGIEDRIGGDAFVSFVDNVLVRAVYEAGVAGLFLILWSFAKVPRLISRTRNVRSAEVEHTLRLPVAVMTFVVVISMFSSSLITYPWNLLYWAFSSGAIGILQSYSLKLAVPDSQPDDANHRGATVTC